MPIRMQSIDYKLERCACIGPTMKINEKRRRRVTPFSHIVLNVTNVDFASSAAPQDFVRM
jgi:hypothetical protein